MRQPLFIYGFDKLLSQGMTQVREVPSSGGERHAGLSVSYSLRHLPIIERLDRQYVLVFVN